MRIVYTGSTLRNVSTGLSGRAAVRGLGCLAAVTLAILLLRAPVLRPTPVSAAETESAAAKRGEATFKQRCIVCHNKQPGDTTPFGPPNLNGIFHGPAAITTKQAEDIIVNGKGQMPPWGKVLTKSDIDDVIAYLKAH